MAATAYQIAPNPVLHFVDNNGVTLAGGLLFTYAAGTTTKLATFTDATGGTPNTNPIVLNSRGECSAWCTPGLNYKFVLAPAADTDPPTSAFWTSDNLSPGSYLNEVIATSITGMTIATGNQTLIVSPTYANFQVGQTVTIVDSAAVANWMFGTITAYLPASGFMTVNVVTTNGSGSGIATWNISLGGSPAIMAAVAILATTGNIGTVATNITSINNVAADLTNINSVNSNATNINTDATNITSINTVASNIASVNTNATNITVIQSASANAAAAAASATAAASTANTLLTIGALANWGLVTDAVGATADYGTVP